MLLLRARLQNGEASPGTSNERRRDRHQEVPPTPALSASTWTTPSDPLDPRTISRWEDDGGYIPTGSGRALLLTLGWPAASSSKPRP